MCETHVGKCCKYKNHAPVAVPPLQIKVLQRSIDEGLPSAPCLRVSHSWHSSYHNYIQFHSKRERKKVHIRLCGDPRTMKGQNAAPLAAGIPTRGHSFPGTMGHSQEDETGIVQHTAAHYAAYCATHYAGHSARGQVPRHRGRVQPFTNPSCSRILHTLALHCICVRLKILNGQRSSLS